MIVKDIIDEDFVNYREPSMLIAFPYCTGKCGKECQNKDLMNSGDILITTEDLIARFINNPITSAIVCGGLEPMDSFPELLDFLFALRRQSDATVVIYTGYEPNEIDSHLNDLQYISNIIVKFGRYIPNEAPHYDEVLGVELSSNNQYGRVVS
jgi:hypothetical protein